MIILSFFILFFKFVTSRDIESHAHGNFTSTTLCRVQEFGLALDKRRDQIIVMSKRKVVTVIRDTCMYWSFSNLCYYSRAQAPDTYLARYVLVYLVIILLTRGT